MEGRIEAGLSRIEADEASGAAQLALQGLQLLADACDAFAAKASPTASSGDIRAPLLELVRRMARLRPSMAPITNWALGFYLELEDRLEREGKSMAERPWRAVLAHQIDRHRALGDKLIDAARAELASARSILTLSYSSTVERLLREAAPEDCRMTVAESRPRLEGRRLCESLLAEGRSVLCITDAEIALFAGRVDLILFGADTICADLAAVNKVGSHTAALAARELGRPCLVAADTYKINPSATAETVELEEKPGAELWPERPGICANVYFEPVPARLITRYLTEKGPLTAKEMASEVERWRRRYEQTGPLP